MPDWKPTLTPELRRRLLDNARRVVRLLELGAPDVVIANDLALLNRKALGGLGPVYWEFLGRQDFWRARAAAGLCARCDEPAVLVGPLGEPLCSGHRSDEDALGRFADQITDDYPVGEYENEDRDEDEE